MRLVSSTLITDILRHIKSKCKYADDSTKGINSSNADHDFSALQGAVSHLQRKELPRLHHQLHNKTVVTHTHTLGIDITPSYCHFTGLSHHEGGQGQGHQTPRRHHEHQPTSQCKSHTDIKASSSTSLLRTLRSFLIPCLLYLTHKYIYSNRH